MSEALQLSGAPQVLTARSGNRVEQRMQRLNRLPIILVLAGAILVIATIVFGLSSRGLWRSGQGSEDGLDRRPATSFADTLKQGIGDGIIGENPPTPVVQPPSRIADLPEVIPAPRLVTQTRPTRDQAVSPAPLELNEDDLWRKRLEREHQEQILNERQRQVMARLQRAEGARASPLRIDTSVLAERLSPLPEGEETGAVRNDLGSKDRLTQRLMAAAQTIDMAGEGLGDPNGQGQKQAFLDKARAARNPGGRLEPLGSRTLLRGSVIPALLLTGLNADLPGRLLAQVSQNVYDSVTGRHLLIPQGSRLVGQYDSKVSYGQSRVLVVWTDIVLPDGKRLDLGAMAGIDQAGEAGFKDKVNRHFMRNFGTAALVALIGTGIDLSLPQSRTAFGVSDPSDAARRSFAETFGRLAEGSVSKGLDTQPTLTIRPGYRFNILVDQDLVFG
ncbi:IncP-type conjugal transfer protein TrbI (plasmid) [Agrobacterium sp. MA01]|uniref:IncP-type conjugal transfer protein TrbI n=1 Tax=Agrobacterium sp. MA01 TaxID=2664893 RepID=UPI00129B2140|nr:IncP-type conjugal transfer protein TrbI [Agrobacterium sp. MA01]QGG93381.1 IncP-type conjugal transfer protein TrbI [Agrobacterium sp. MA01]